MKLLFKLFTLKQFIREAFILVMILCVLSCEKEEVQQGTQGPNKPPIEDETNYPPVANAGPDQTIILPLNIIYLDGNGSSDADNNITSYLWTLLSGPTTINIGNTNTVQLQLTNLVEGVYEFELKVTDALGLYSVDNIKVTVLPHIINGLCDNSERTQVSVQWIPLGSLSKSRQDIALAVVGNKILFAGGVWTSDCPECWGSSKVDIYDTVTLQWSTAELSKGRHGIAATTVGSKIFFAGGANGDGAFDLLFSTVDIYDASTGFWSVANLSEPRAYIAAATLGSKVYFAGGEKDFDYQTSNVIDIYNLDTNTWSTSTLSEARAYISATTVNNKVYFAGGQKEDRWYAQPSNNIDVYDNATGTWSLSTLSKPMGFPSSIATGEKIYWASGCDVEIKTINNWNSLNANLHKSGDTQFDIPNASVKDDKIIFLRTSYYGIDSFDIYNTTTNSWSVGVLPQKVYNASMVTLNNEIYLTAQTSTGSTQLWKLEF